MNFADARTVFQKKSVHIGENNKQVRIDNMRNMNRQDIVVAKRDFLSRQSQITIHE